MSEIIKINELEPHPENYNTHPRFQIKQLRKSLKIYGQVREIIIWKNYIVAGHGVVRAAKEEKLEELRATRLPDDWPEEKVTSYLAADNETGRLSAPDNEQLAKLLTAVSDEKLRELAAGGEDRLRELLGIEVENTDPGPQTDRAAELQEKWQVERGQVWEAGPHKVICGNSKEVDIPDGISLVLTDPPYGISIVKAESGGAAAIGGAKPVTIGTIRPRRPYPFGGVKNRGTVGATNMVDATLYRPVEGDNEPFEPEWLLGIGKNQILFGGNYFASKLPDSRCWIVWDKDNTGNFADAELAWTSFDRSVKLYKFTWNGLVREGSRDIEGVKRFHPTQKPAGLFSDILNDFSDEGDIVFDPYLGSGTTLVACQTTNRVGIGVDIDPAYVAVTLERLSGMGLEPSVIVG